MKQILEKYVLKKGEIKELDQVWEFGESGKMESVEIRAVVAEGAFFSAKGKIKIKKKVNGVEAFLRYKVLLLGSGSRAVVIPELEIESNEVRASHAAAIGKIDDEELFYLMSRGIDRKEAEKLIIKAFLNE